MNSQLPRSRLPDEFTDSAVPDERTVGGVRIGLVIIGMGINFTAFALAAEAVIGAGFVRGIGACLVAGVLLAIGGALTGYVGAKSRLSAFAILQFTFGRKGATVVNLFLTLLAFGFFCVLSSMLGAAIGSLALSLGWTISPVVSSLLGSLLVAVATLYGFTALQRITFALLPILLLGLLYLAGLAIRSAGLAAIIEYPGRGVPFGVGVSAVLGGLVGFVVLFPNLTRYARTGKDGVVAGIVGMAIGFPLILLLSAIACVATGHKDVVAILSALGLGWIATGFAATSIWKTNVLNLYSTYLGIGAFWPNVSRVWVVLVAAVLGGVLGAVDVETYFLPFLLFLGVTAPPIAVIYTIDCLVHPPSADVPTVAYRWTALWCWAAASAFGGASLLGMIRFTGVPSIDAALGAGAIFGLTLRRAEPLRSRSV